MESRVKLLRITTVPISFGLLEGQVDFMSENGFDVYLASSGEGKEKAEQKLGRPIVTLPLTRQISIAKDIKALFCTYRLIKRIKPDIIHTHTPKAGLIGMLAGYIARVPIRMHTIAGLPLMEAKGFKRIVLNFIERLTNYYATNTYPNSKVQYQFMIENKLCSPVKSKVLGNGSSNGINLERFKRSTSLDEEARLIRQKYGISKDGFVYGLVGRIVSDKGVRELVRAFVNLNIPNSYLLLVGGREEYLNPLDDDIKNSIENEANIIEVGHVEDVRPYFLAMDVFTFPSYREGFPNVVLQACALAVPCIVSNINGCNEIIIDGDNGLIVPAKNSTLLQKKMELIFSNSLLRNQFKEKSRGRIEKLYSQEFVWKCIKQEYNDLIKKVNVSESLEGNI